MEYKFFTIDEANSLIPEVRYLVKLMNSGKTNLIEAILQAEYLKSNVGFNGNRKELEKKLKEVMTYGGTLASVHHTLLGKGVIVRDYETGSIDFPTIVNGEPGYLSWNTDEESVHHWHKVEEEEIFTIDEDTRVLHQENNDE